MKSTYFFTLYYIFYFIFFYFFMNYNTFHNINATVLISEIIQILFNIIRELQVEIIKLKTLKISISITYNKNIILILNYVSISKFKKFPDLPMFNDIRKELCLFIIKLYFKLKRNINWFLININKISYKISYLKEDVTAIIDFFY